MSSAAQPAHRELIRDHEDVLAQVGGWGRYQFRLCVFFVLFSIFNAYSIYAPVLVLHTPDHWCSLDHLVERARQDKAGNW